MTDEDRFAWVNEETKQRVLKRKRELLECRWWQIVKRSDATMLYKTALLRATYEEQENKRLAAEESRKALDMDQLATRLVEAQREALARAWWEGWDAYRDAYASGKDDPVYNPYGGDCHAYAPNDTPLDPEGSEQPGDSRSHHHRPG